MRWDLFCRVIDNFGDIGVAWRLAADLAGRGESVRMWVDDAGPLRWMAPHGAPGVEVRRWPADDKEDGEPGDVVIELFGCHLPAHFIQRMAERKPAPTWINLEYLSAEDFVEASHGLLSPQASGPAGGLRKWFFFPGFTSRTGGLLREPDLMARQAAFDPSAWRLSQGAAAMPGERCVSLFCYENPALPALLDELSSSPTLLLVTPGLAARQVRERMGVRSRIGVRSSVGALRVHVLPELSQLDYDHLLWSCDLNLVRGEDSFVRAQWSGRPFIWQIYPQHDGAHAAKLAAFNNLFLASAAPPLQAAIRNSARRWNGLGEGRDEPVLPPAALFGDWRRHCEAWRDRLGRLTDLTSRLCAFVGEHR